MAALTVMWRPGYPTYVCLICRLKGSPTMIVAGGAAGAEDQNHQINTLVERMGHDLGEKVHYQSPGCGS